jgi:hypothetical protein
MNICTNYIFKTIVTSVLITIIFSSVLHSQDSKSRSKEKSYRFIYSKDLFFNTKFEDAIALTKIFTEKIKKQKNVKDEYEIIICENSNDLLEATKTNFDFVLSST